MKTEHGQNFLTSSHLYQAAKQEVQKALGSIGIKPMAEVKVEPIKRGEQKVTPFQAVVRVLETAGVIYGAIDAGYMLWTKANTGHTDELTTRLFQTVYDEVQAGLNNNKVVIPGVDGKDLTVTMTPAAPTETPTETLTPTATETQVPTPEKTFPVCKTEKYKDCVIYDGASIPEAINALSQYHDWLQTLSKPFDATKIKDVPFETRQEDWGTAIIYKAETTPNFKDPTTRPFRRDVTAGVLYMNYFGNKVPYLVLPIEYFDKNDPEHNKWVIAVYSTYGGIIPGSNEYSPVPNPHSIIQTAISMWKNDMNITPITENTTTQLTISEDPLIRKVFDNYQNTSENMPERFKRFVDGDLSALSQPGIIVNTEVFSGGNLYK